MYSGNDSYFFKLIMRMVVVGNLDRYIGGVKQDEAMATREQKGLWRKMAKFGRLLMLMTEVVGGPCDPSGC